MHINNGFRGNAPARILDRSGVADLRRYAEEQASLHRVAMLVAQAMPPAAIFSAASREVEALFSADAAAVVKFEHDPPALIIVGTGDNMQSSAIGRRSAFVDGYASTGVFRTGRSARVDAREGEVLDGPVYTYARMAASGDSLRPTSALASPIVVERMLWGAMTLSASRSLAPDTEARLERFTDIVGTAIANADSREAFATLAAEQAALRRIATYVAKGRRPEEIFAFVTDEVAAVMGTMAAVARFDHGGRSVVITGISEETGISVGTRLDLSEGTASAEVHRTGRPARVDGFNWSMRGGSVAEAERRLGIISRVASPIVVEGHLWGTITALGRARLAEDAEQRIERFAELLATVIANAESKYQLAALRSTIVSADDEEVTLDSTPCPPREAHRQPRYAVRQGAAVDLAERTRPAAEVQLAAGAPHRRPALLEQAGTRLARESLLEALESTIWTGLCGSAVDAHAVALAALTSPRLPQEQATVADLLLDGFAQLVADGHKTGLPSLRQAVAALRERLVTDDEQLPRWMGLGVLAAAEICDDHAHHDLASRWVVLAREQRGEPNTLPLALASLGFAEVSAGRYDAAEVRFTEACSIAAATGCPCVPAEVGDVLLRASRGREPDARGLTPRHGAGMSLVPGALAILELGRGNYASAMTAAMQVYNDDPLCVGTLALPNLIEAACRCDDRATAALALERLSTRTRASGTPLALGLLARSQALLARDSEAERFHRAAIGYLERSSGTTELARAHLLQGEWLRRCRRRCDARGHLRAAYDMFNSMGATAFAERAGIELRATGERARKRVPETVDDLTPQEVQIATLAAQGATNVQIGTRLFISANTVAYHLRKVFRKLDVTSRRQLAQELSERATQDKPVDGRQSAEPIAV
jgi:DNA-binding CsgD family transcriptional regulator